MTEIITDLEMIDANKYFLVTDNGKILFTSDCGQIWDLQFDNPQLTNFINYIEMFDKNNGIAMGDMPFASPNYNLGPAIFLKTTNGGTNWISVNDSAFGGWSGDLWRRVDFVDQSFGLFYESGINPQKIYKTTDGCTNWWETNYSGSLTVLKCYDQNIALAQSMNPLKISRTTDGGFTWEELLSPFGYGEDFEFIPGNPNKVFYLSNNNLYFSYDMGNNWYEIFVDTASYIGRDIVFINENVGWFLCDEGKVYRTTNGGETNIIDELIFPTNFSLSQNYPNPFNPSTIIKYAISSIQLVTLKVYDILGSEVATIVNQEQNAGSYNVDFNASKLSSGIYFYHLQAGSFVETKKMILIK